SPHKRTNQTPILGKRVALGCAHPSGNRARAGSWCCTRGPAARRSRRTHRRGRRGRDMMLGLKPERFALDDFITQPISICGRTFLAHQSGALFWPAERTLIVADLHFEKGSAYASRGLMLPPYDTRQTLLRLAQVIDGLEAETVVALGDSFHDSGAAARICEDD